MSFETKLLQGWNFYIYSYSDATKAASSNPWVFLTASVSNKFQTASFWALCTSPCLVWKYDINVWFGSRLNVNHDFSQLNSISVVKGGFVVISKFHIAVPIQISQGNRPLSGPFLSRFKKGVKVAWLQTSQHLMSFPFFDPINFLSSWPVCWYSSWSTELIW